MLVKPYLSMQETVDFVFELTGEKINWSTLEELSNVEQLTPVFLFSGYVSYPDINHKTIRYDKMKAYFTHDDFFMHKTRNYESYSMHSDADVPEWIEIHSPFTIQNIIKHQSSAYEVHDEVFLFKNPPIGELDKLDDLKYSQIDFDDVRFSRNELIVIFDIKPEKRTAQNEFDFYLGAMGAIKERASAEISRRSELSLVGNQKILASYALFTPHHIACFLSNENPAYEQNNNMYCAYLDMVKNAIEADVLKPINEKEQLSTEQVKEWLANNNFVYRGFNDGTPTYADQLAEMKEEGVAAHVKVLNLTDKLEDLELDNMLKTHVASELNDSSKEDKKRIAELEHQLADKNTNASFMMGSPTVEQGEPRDSEQIISDLKKQIKQLTSDQDQTQTTIAKLKEQLNIANTTLTNAKSVSIAQPFDWQNMSEHIYPPELHLALMVWQRIYWDNELKDSHITSHNGKFEAIAKKINLNPKSTLGKRVRMVINTAHTKKKQSELAEQLQAIEHINISAN